jgi:hypothetical protein
MQQRIRPLLCGSLQRVLRTVPTRFAMLVVIVLLLCGGLHAQNYSWDARGVGMGGDTGMGTGNLAAEMVPADRSYTSIVIPLGLIQLVEHLKVFDPNDPKFDGLRAIDYVASPFHYNFGRSTSTGNDFISTIVNSGFSRDLNAYRGFTPPEHLVAGGLLAPNWGHTFKVHHGANQSFQGIYIGAGPHISLQTDMRFDASLLSILDSPVSVKVPANTLYNASNIATQQTAVAGTVGYRAKFGFSSSTSIRDGVYLALDVSYLYGLRQDIANSHLQLATDGSGLVTVTPTQIPLSIDYLFSTSGRGYTGDAGIAVVKSGWEIGVGANGIRNRLDWTHHREQHFSMTSVVNGAGFIKTDLPSPTGVIRQVLPIEYVSDLGYSRGRWTLRTDENYGLLKLSGHAGAEIRLGRVALRGGARYLLTKWNPTGGIGLNFTRRFGIDVGLYGNSTNLEEQRHLAMAVSLRIEHPIEK